MIAPGIWLVSRVAVEGRPRQDAADRSESGDGHHGRGYGLCWPVGIAAFFATLLPGGVTAFLVLGLVEVGLRPAVAGIVFAFAAGLCVVVRLIGGVLIDRYASDGYLPVVVLLVGGGAGAGLLALGRPALSVAAAFLALPLGYGWPGIMFFLAVNGRPESPGLASVIIHVGGLLGAATGPALTGLLIGLFGWGAAWAALGISSVLGASTLAYQRPRARRPQASRSEG